MIPSSIEAYTIVCASIMRRLILYGGLHCQGRTILYGGFNEVDVSARTGWRCEELMHIPLTFERAGCCVFVVLLCKWTSLAESDLCNLAAGGTFYVSLVRSFGCVFWVGRLLPKVALCVFCMSMMYGLF